MAPTLITCPDCRGAGWYYAPVEDECFDAPTDCATCCASGMVPEHLNCRACGWAIPFCADAVADPLCPSCAEAEALAVKIVADMLERRRLAEGSNAA